MSVWVSGLCLQDLEEMGRELGPLHDQLDDKVRPLTGGLSDGSLANSVHEAEQHAKELNESAAILDKWVRIGLMCGGLG